MPPRRPCLRTTATRRGLAVAKLSTVEDDLPPTFIYPPALLSRPLDQGVCGSCWAFAIAGVITDMVLIQSQGRLHVPVSAQQILQCADVFHNGDPCDGNDVAYALESLPAAGIVPEAVFPYKQRTNPYVGNKPCPSFPESMYRAGVVNVSGYVVGGSNNIAANVVAMKRHIRDKGPIIGALLAVYDDFMYYDGVSVYTPLPGQRSLGGHAVEIVGWGTNDDGVSYWVCQHDWGADFPNSSLPGMDRNWMYIRMGVNASRIEEIAYGIDAVFTTDDDTPYNVAASGAVDTAVITDPPTHPVSTSTTPYTLPTYLDETSVLFAAVVFVLIVLLIAYIMSTIYVPA